MYAPSVRGGNISDAGRQCKRIIRRDYWITKRTVGTSRRRSSRTRSLFGKFFQQNSTKAVYSSSVIRFGGTGASGQTGRFSFVSVVFISAFPMLDDLSIQLRRSEAKT